MLARDNSIVSFAFARLIGINSDGYCITVQIRIKFPRLID